MDQKIHVGAVGTQASVTLRGLERARSTLEDFSASYLMFHGLDASKPSDLFKHLPLLAYAEVRAVAESSGTIHHSTTTILCQVVHIDETNGTCLNDFILRSRLHDPHRQERPD